MAGGGEPALIEEWKAAVLEESDPELRGVYRDIALVFAELTPTHVNWRQALEGWGVQESQTVNGWIRRGEERGELKRARADLLRAVRLRLANPVPEAIRLAVEGTSDLDILTRWLDLALTLDGIRAFAAGMVDGPAGEGP